MECVDTNKMAQKQWFAMRVTFRRELGVKQMLDVEHIENFIPMRQEMRLVRGRKVKVMVPVIHNLIFVHAEKELLQSFKSKVPHLQYMTVRTAGKNQPIIVPESQMKDFITVSSSDDSNLVYFDAAECSIPAGTKVRICGGAFDGVTGNFVKVKGKRNKKVVLAIQNVMAVAIDAFSYDSIEVIND